jgi:hypothetical protein
MSNWLRELRFRALMVSVSLGGVAVVAFVASAVLALPSAPPTGDGGMLGTIPGLSGVLGKVEQ